MLLENDCIRVQLDPATGAFLSLYDKTAETECIAPEPGSMLFRAILPDGESLGHHVDSAGAVIAVNGPAATINYTFSEFTAQVWLTLDGAAVTATLRVTNTGRLTIEEVQFPWVNGIRRLPDDAIIMPSFTKRIIRDPLGEGLGGDHRHAEEYGKKIVMRYPERMTTAWCNYGNAERGIALEARHTDFSIVDFFVHKRITKSDTGLQRALNLGAVHPKRIRPGETWTSPPIRIALHAGDWHAAADAHRQWVETWIVKPDRPAKFAESVGWHYFFMKHQDGSARFTYADLPRMAEAALAGGCRYLMLFGWHEPGHDNAYLYRYVANREWGGETALREALEKVRALGVEPIPFYNGTLANTQLPEHREFGHRWEALTREGHAYYAGDWAGFCVDAPNAGRGRVHHEICLCDEYRPHFFETATRLIEQYGFGNLQLDQLGIKIAPCYNEAHGHPAPDRAFVDAWCELLPKIRQALRARYPEGVMISECSNEFVGQWCDGAWTWDFASDAEPILYSTPWLLTSTAIDANEYDAANRAFAHKISLDLRIGGGDELLSDYPTFAAHIKGLSELRRRAAAYYVYADFRDREGIAAAGPGYEAKTYRNRATGKASIVVAELKGEATPVILQSAWKPASNTARVEFNSGETATLSAADEICFDLPAYGVAVICLEV